MKPLTNLLAVVILAIALSGCKKGQSEMMQAGVPPPKLQPGWTTYDLGNFSFAASPDFTRTAPSAMGIDTGGMTIGPDGEIIQAPPPKLENKTEKVQVDNAEKLLLTLYDKRVRPVPGESPTRLEVRHEEGFSTLAEAVEDVKKGQDVKEHEDLTLPSGKAALVRSIDKQINGDELKKLYYIFVHDGRQYVFKFETVGAIEGLEPDGKVILETLRFK